MATRNILIGVLTTFGLAFSGALLGADPQPPADPRTAALEQKVGELQTRLAKIDGIVEQLNRIRNEDLPKIERGIRGTETTSGHISQDVAGGNSQTGSAGPVPEKSVRVAESLEDKVAQLEMRLRSLDDVAAQISALHNEDLPKLEREVRGLRETSGRVQHETRMPAEPTQGYLVINNFSGATRSVAVNGISYPVPPGVSTSVAVPLGNVTTQLSWEGPKTWGNDRWARTDHGYEMRLDLK